jgi:GDPmannose 4,6-dehydratase
MKDKKIAIVTGITGQDGSYLAELLLEKDYKVFGMKRRTSSNSLGCSSHLANEPQLEFVEADLTDFPSILSLCKSIRPCEFYNLAAQSHVGISFAQPIATAEITGIGVLNCLEAVRQSGFHTKFLQASTSELFGGVNGETFMNEESPMHPRSPYGVSKLFGYWTTINYRESYRMFACNSICFNHEGPRRSTNFVTRKISKAVAAIKHNLQDVLYLGNLEAKRDWGHAKDYTNAMYLMLQHHDPEEFVLATGETHSVREFCEIAFSHVGLNYQDYVKIDPAFYRPAEVDILLGDATKAKTLLGWERHQSFKDLVIEMVDYDLSLLDSLQE